MNDIKKSQEWMTVHDLTLRMEEARDTLAAIRSGEVDALVVASGADRLVFVLKGADQAHRVLFETMNEGAITLAEDGTILRANLRFAELLGRPLETVLGEPMSCFVDPGSAPVLARLLQEVARGRAKGEVALATGDGGVLPALLSMGVVEGEKGEAGENGERSYTVVVTDLTELKEAQRALQRANEELEIKVAARTEELSRANEALREEIAQRAALEAELRRQAEALADADRRKDEFLSMLAHELRNPLAPIVAAVELLRGAVVGEKKLETYRSVIERQARHLAHLVDDLLDVARLARRSIALNKRPLDLAAAVQSAVEAARPTITSGRHSLSVSLPAEPVQILADPTRFEQILVNLLNNAAKYTQPGGRIEVHAERRGDKAVIRVRDNGIGIAEELLPRVFDLFVQAERSLDRSQGGLGIGLTMVKRLVELHKGEVEARSGGLGQGSEFEVRIPAAPADRAEAAVAPRPSAPGADGVVERTGQATDDGASGPRARVLMIEDNADAAQTMHDLVVRWGYEVFLASDGDAGIKLAQSVKPHVVLIDIGLPGMDGYEVARRIRAGLSDGGSDPVLIGVTGYGQAQDRRLSHEAGIHHHLVKPPDPSALRALLDASCTGVAEA